MSALAFALTFVLLQDRENYLGTSFETSQRKFKLFKVSSPGGKIRLKYPINASLLINNTTSYIINCQHSIR